MTKFSLSKFSLAAFSGAAVLMVVASMATPANAALGGSKFRATPEELRRHCWRIDETFWMSKRRYGCGEIFCAEGKCRTVFNPPQYRPPTYPIPGANGGEGGGGQRGAGGGGGGQSGGSAGAAAN
jgi:hypothetical protein